MCYLTNEIQYKIERIISPARLLPYNNPVFYLQDDHLECPQDISDRDACTKLQKTDNIVGKFSILFD